MSTANAVPRTNKSRQRDMILKVLSSTKSHPTAEWIYQQARQQMPNISLGTVYRNLSKLAEVGEILKLDVGDGFDHFDATATPHYHMVCNSCGRVLDVEMDYDRDLDAKAKRSTGGKIDGHSVIFYGCCQDCSKA